MSSFQQEVKKIQARFELMCQGTLVSPPTLVRTNVDPDTMWETYLNSFSAENNPVFRHPESSTMNCSHDRHFIRKYGNICSIVNGELISMWDIEADEQYAASFKALNALVTSAPIEGYFVETKNSLNQMPYEKINPRNSHYQLGFNRSTAIYTPETSFGKVEAGRVYEFFHFNVAIPKSLVYEVNKSIESIAGELNTSRQVFDRLLKEVTVDTYRMVLDFIHQGSVINSEQHIPVLEKLIALKEEYDNSSNKELFSWVTAKGHSLAKFRNTALGTLCVSLQVEDEVEPCIEAYNKMVDAVNYKRAVAPISNRQKQEAAKYVEENGYLPAFNRRYATIEDLNASNVLHVNKDAKVNPVSIFDAVPTKGGKELNLKSIPEVTIGDFMQNILPTAQKVEVYFENRLQENLVCLHTADADKNIFAWDNNFGWTYRNNLTGVSNIAKAVKEKGGNIDGVLRCSISWADNNDDNSDLDLHCEVDNTYHIYYATKRAYISQLQGSLDVDIQTPSGNLAVENIVFTNKNLLKNRRLTFYVHQFASRGSKGFSAELVIGEETFTYHYNHPVRDNVKLAEVKYDNNGNYTITHLLTPSESVTKSKKVWNIDTLDFHEVKMLSFSPNYWNSQVGNKHYFFFLNQCSPDEEVTGLHAEFLNNDLLPHRKVVSHLGYNTRMKKDQANILAGVGFNATVRDHVILKVTGSHTRMIKVNF